jgi:putative SOS response-associated peptidase YedK
MKPYHDRQPVIVPPERWAEWLDETADPAGLLQPSPAGGLAAEAAPRQGTDQRTLI